MGTRDTNDVNGPLSTSNTTSRDNADPTNNNNTQNTSSNSNNSHHRHDGIGSTTNIFQEVWTSSEMLFSTQLNWLLLLGPVALMGDATGFLGEAACFAFSGIALIPCAERLSYVTEQVAEHTNGTIGALLNATFGNAPELLIATAALRSGYYRVVQLAMLGSMLTNLLFVFGMSCLIGGLRWQVQELRITSGNVSVGMLLLSVAGSLLPACLILSGQLRTSEDDDVPANVPTKAELHFSRLNAFVLMLMYGCYLIFQLGTHKEEFDNEENVIDSANGHQLHLSPHFTSRHGRQNQAKRNIFCLNILSRFYTFHPPPTSSGRRPGYFSPTRPTSFGAYSPVGHTGGDVEMSFPANSFNDRANENDDNSDRVVAGAGDDDHSSTSGSSTEEGHTLLPQNQQIRDSSSSYANGYFDEYVSNSETETDSCRRRGGGGGGGGGGGSVSMTTRSLGKISPSNSRHNNTNKHDMMPPGRLVPLGLVDPNDPTTAHNAQTSPPIPSQQEQHVPQMSFRVGIVWLFIITLCISAMSDILVDTIDGFAFKLHISEVFTSMVIVPFFSNVAEQVSAVLFAYRNEMDLCVGVTVGSAIQVATFVLPGCVLIGMVVDRSMTLYFHAYETMCLFLSVIVIAAILQGGTTNWLVGMTCISIYVMMAAGFWFHTLEDLSVDEELIVHNSTGAT